MRLLKILIGKYIGRYYGFTQSAPSQNKRHLVGTIDASQSVISGTGNTLILTA